MVEASRDGFTDAASLSALDPRPDATAAGPGPTRDRSARGKPIRTVVGLLARRDAAAALSGCLVTFEGRTRFTRPKRRAAPALKNGTFADAKVRRCNASCSPGD